MLEEGNVATFTLNPRLSCDRPHCLLYSSMSAIADGCFVTFYAVLFSPSVFICPDRHTAVQDIDYHLRMLDVNMRFNCRMSQNRGLETADFGILQVTCPRVVPARPEAVRPAKPGPI